MLDEKGSFYLIESILAIAILLMAVFVVNTVISIPSPEYSYDSLDFKTSHDVMEALSGKVNFTDEEWAFMVGQIVASLRSKRISSS